MNSSHPRHSGEYLLQGVSVSIECINDSTPATYFKLPVNTSTARPDARARKTRFRGSESTAIAHPRAECYTKQQVLSASVHDVRYFSTLLRGISFPNINVSGLLQNCVVRRDLSPACDSHHHYKRIHNHRRGCS